MLREKMLGDKGGKKEGGSGLRLLSVQVQLLPTTSANKKVHCRHGAQGRE